jgi:triphosphoribosyl-dephospho-CoA synthase
VQGNGASKGRTAARRYGLRAAGEEAALGFPTLFEHALPALRMARQAGLDDRRARLHVLFATIAALDDTTIAHRGGLAGLRFAQQCAGDFLQRGGGLSPDAVEAAQAIHREFVSRRLSPGGSADILAAACWIERICRTA